MVVAKVVGAEVEAAEEASVEVVASSEEVERAVTPPPLTWMLSALPELPL